MPQVGGTYSSRNTAGARADLNEAVEINPYFDPLDSVVSTQTLLETLETLTT